MLGDLILFLGDVLYGTGEPAAETRRGRKLVVAITATILVAAVAALLIAVI
jgi:hypothetical protein